MNNIFVTVFNSILAAVSTIICAYIAADNKKRGKAQDKRDKEEEERASQRAKEGRLQLRMLNANSQLTVGVAMALKRGHCNGEVEEGLKAVKEANDEYTKFLEDIAINNIRGE